MSFYKSISTLVLTTAIASTAVADNNSTNNNKKPASEEKKQETVFTKQELSYALGFDMAYNLKQIDVDLDRQQIILGLKETLEGKSKVTKSEALMALKQLEKQMREKVIAKMHKEASENQKKSENFFKENKTKKDVMSTESGLQYKKLKSGDAAGLQPSGNDMVTVHYKGTLLDGSTFDSSYERKEPAQFPVSAVIPGWQEALKLMRPGDKWMVYVPPKLGYGKSGIGGAIPPNATLIFEIDLLSVDKSSKENKK